MRKLILLAALVVAAPALGVTKARHAMVKDAPISLLDVCTGDGVADDTVCFRNAATTGRPIVVPKPSAFYKVTGKITLTNSIVGLGMPEIRMVGADGTDAYAILEVLDYSGPGLTITGLHLNGGWDEVTMPGGANNEHSHLVKIRGSDNVTVEGNRLEKAFGDDVYVGPLPGMEDNSTNVHIRRNWMRSPRRCNVAVTGGIGVWVEDNDIGKVADYVAAIDLEPNEVGTVENVHIVGNKFDVTSNAFVTLGEFAANPNPKRNVWVEGNTGTSVRMVHKLLSDEGAATGWENIQIRGNTYLGHSTVAKKSVVAMVEMNTPGTTVDVCKKVVIEGNIDLAGQVDTGPTAGWLLQGCEDVVVANNLIDPAVARQGGINTRGLRKAQFVGNVIRGVVAAGSGGAAITFEDLSGVTASDITLSGNYFGERMYVGASVTDASFMGNTWTSASGHIRLESGTVSGWQLIGNRFAGAGVKWSVGTGAKSRVTDVGEVLTASLATDPASVGANSCAETAVTVTGAVAGSECVVGTPSGTSVSLTLTCRVSAPDTAQIRFCNATASPADPPNATYTVRVFNP